MPSPVRTRSYGSVKVFWLDRDEALRRLRRAATQLLDQHPEVMGIYLFGSLAEGRAVPGSDADLLVILGRSDRRPLDRPLDYQPAFEEVGMPVELFCYTRDELIRIPMARAARERALPLASRASG